MKFVFSIIVILFSPLLIYAQEIKFSTQCKEDFNYFWKSIEEEYCYFNKKQTDWEKVKLIYAPMIDTVKSRDAFVTVLESAIGELYDHHCGLHTNTAVSRRLVPTSTDVWAEYLNGVPTISEVRKKTGADSCGIVAGMEVLSVDDIPVEKAIFPFLPKSLKEPDTEAKAFALRSLLAGDHIHPRKFLLKYKNNTTAYFPDKAGLNMEKFSYPGKLETNLYGDIGYIKINNCLYDNGLIAAFDSVMSTMNKTKGLILDLRETPSGGNTAVARAILGWFINKEHFYQRHEYYAEEKQNGIKRSWEEIVSPRKNKYYDKPLAILVNHWTGSIAEGITIGFDALQRKNTTIIGTTMARLNGAVYSYEMPNTKIGFSFVAERLYHINGLPREQYIPPLYINLMKPGVMTFNDIFINTALKFLNHN